MIFNDYWTQGLNAKQQALIVEYFQNACNIKPNMGGYKSISYMKRFVNSNKGRTATRKYGEFLLDLKKDTVKLQLLKIFFVRTFFNPADIITAKGELLPEYGGDLRKLGDLTYCIEGIERIVNSNGYANLKIKLCDRNKSREVIEKIFNIYDRDDIDDVTGEKAVFEMTDEERDLEIKYLLDKQGLIEHKEKEENNV